MTEPTFPAGSVGPGPFPGDTERLGAAAIGAAQDLTRRLPRW
jgi:hypothetical protein